MKKQQRKGSGAIFYVCVFITAGILFAAIVLSQRDQLVFTEPALTQEMSQEEAPLGLSPGEKSTVTRTSVHIKKVTIKEASTRTYTKNLGTKSTSVTKDGAEVRTQTRVDVRTTEKYTKGSRIKEVTTKTTTTVITTMKKATRQSETVAAQSGSKLQTMDLRSLAPSLDSRLISAFQGLGFDVVIDKGMTSSDGIFNVKERTITLKQDTGSQIFHEMGHFLAVLSGNVDKSASFKKIFKAERKKFAGTYKSLATKNSQEFFAECVREYYTHRTKLKGWCPKTYMEIEKAIENVTSESIARMRKTYAKYWS